MPGVARDTHDCDSASEEEVSRCLYRCVMVRVVLWGVFVVVVGSLVLREIGGRGVCGTMRRQFIEMIVLNMRIEAIDSGCTYQVISEAQMCMCWAFGGGVVRGVRRKFRSRTSKYSCSGDEVSKP